MDFTEQHNINEEFLRRFPLEKLKDMTLEQYTNLNGSDSFCYWIEFKTKILGSVSGNTSYKFGIYQYNQKPSKDQTTKRYDDKYTWYSNLGATAIEAYEKVKEAVINIAENGRKGNLEAIESIQVIAPMIKWKIAFIYSNETIVPYYSLDRLQVIAYNMGMNNANDASISEIQKFLISKRNGMDIHEYGKILNDIWHQHDPSLQDPSQKLWMWSGDEYTFELSELRCGSSAKGKLMFEEYSSKKELSEDYRKAVQKDDVQIPSMYWRFMKEVKKGDIVVVFGTKREGTQYHLLYGWGKFTSDVSFDYTNENPISRTVEWHSPQPSAPITDTQTKNALFFHRIKDKDSEYIMNLLNMIENESAQTMNSNKEYIQLLKVNKNLILTGAPGTGKTYKAREMAREMLGLKSIEELKTDKRYGFVQFHPSYDYTDFVEGLRPKNDDKGIGFERKDGVFKEFCKQAILSEAADADTLNDINSNPTVWKVSLEGTGDNPTRTDCMDNNYIRIGWEKYGDVEFSDYNDYFEGGKNVLRAFQNSMEIGDLVVSCYSAKEIDAVGVITGNYEYRSEGGKYPRYRAVKWLVKNIRENIVDLNKNKAFTLSTVYKASITAEAALKIVKKHSQMVNNSPRADTAVFVIDEINRGEISKIFGELFFSIDPGYRGINGIVKTQYQNLIEDGDAFKDGFYVPENVYIIGTMNDIDRSVESMDFAMRRRFAWKEVSAEESQRMLAGLPYEAEAKARMNRLNDAILKTRGLGKAYQIGAAYFMKIRDYQGDFGKLWEYHLEGLLYEYHRGNNDASKQLEQLKNAYDGIE